MRYYNSLLVKLVIRLYEHSIHVRNQLCISESGRAFGLNHISESFCTTVTSQSWLWLMLTHKLLDIILSLFGREHARPANHLTVNVLFTVIEFFRLRRVDCELSEVAPQ